MRLALLLPTGGGSSSTGSSILELTNDSCVAYTFTPALLHRMTFTLVLGNLFILSALSEHDRKCRTYSTQQVQAARLEGKNCKTEEQASRELGEQRAKATIERQKQLG